MAEKTVAIIGGGAAGIFAAARLAEEAPELNVVLLERAAKFLQKVRISGGGRCNVTHRPLSPSKFAANYPRGAKRLKKQLARFGPKETIDWFEARGAPLKTEDDGRVFPVTDASETIIACLKRAAGGPNVVLRTRARVDSFLKLDSGFLLDLQKDESLRADALLIATGGEPKSLSYDWLRAAGLEIAPPAPSLFTFNLPENPFKGLEGVAAPDAKVRIAGAKIEQAGPALVTHWGLSGPAILRASAWGARALQDRQYQFTALVNFWAAQNDASLEAYWSETKRLHPKKLVRNSAPPTVPTRLWARLCETAGAEPDVRWAELPGKVRRKLTEAVLRFPCEVRGKTTFKEEFVTCGGVALPEIDPETQQCRKLPGLFFAGEVLDVDGVTGGFNFQNAWTSGWLAAGGIIDYLRAR